MTFALWVVEHHYMIENAIQWMYFQGNPSVAQGSYFSNFLWVFSLDGRMWSLAQILAQLFTNPVTLGKSTHICQQNSFSSFMKTIKLFIPRMDAVRIKWTIHMKYLEQCLACGKHSINVSYNYLHDSQNQLTLLSCRFMYPPGAAGEDALLKSQASQTHHAPNRTPL